MSFRDLFFVREEDKAPAVAQQSTEIQKEVFHPVSYSNKSESKGLMSDENMVSKIWDQIISRNLPGPDYLELRNNASALESLPLSEEQKLEAAFKVLHNQYPNLSKEVILKSIDTYIGIVDEEKRAGLEECKKARDLTVGEKESRVKVMRETNVEILKQIDDLKKRYDETQQKIGSMEHEILSDKQELDTKERMFNDSIQTVISVLMNDKNKISMLNI